MRNQLLRHAVGNVPGPRLNSVDVACQRLGIGRTVLYRAMHKHEDYRRGLPRLRSVTIGGRRLIPEDALSEFVAALEIQSAE